MTENKLSSKVETTSILPSMGGTLRQQALMLRQVLETAPCGIAFISKEQELGWMNARFEQCFGYGKKEMTGKSVKDLVPPRFRKKQAKGQKSYLKAPFTRFLGTGKAFLGLCRDETETLLDIGFSPVSSNPEHGTTAWVIPMMPHRRQTPFSQLIEQVIENASEPIFIVGKNFSIQYMNRAFEVARDLSRQDMVGKKVIDLLGEEVFQDSVKSYLNLSFEGETLRYYEKISFRGIESRAMEMTYLPIYSAGGKVEFVVVIAGHLDDNDKKMEQLFIKGLLSMPNSMRNKEEESGTDELVEEDSMQQRILTLSVSQRAVLTLVSQGKTNKEIAEILDLNEKTIRNQLTVIYRALGVTRRSEAVAVFVRLAVPLGKADSK